MTKRISTILSAIALFGALTLNAEAATFTYTGTVLDATGALAGLTPVDSVIGGPIDIDNAAVGAGFAGPGDVTDIGVQLDPPGDPVGFCFVWMGGACAAGAEVPIVSIDAGTALTFIGGLSSGGTLNITAFSPTFGINIAIMFDITNGTFFAAEPNLGTVSGTGTLTPAVPIPAAVWLFGSGLLGLAGLRRRKVV